MEGASDTELFRWAARDDVDAAAYLKVVTDAAHVLDDLVDLDRRARPCDVLEALYAGLVGIPANPFYRAHRDVLDAVQAVAWANWHVATALERDNAHLHVAYIIRSSYIDLVVHVAAIVGGPEWAAIVARRIRIINQDETFEQYLDGLTRESNLRDNGGH